MQRRVFLTALASLSVIRTHDRKLNRVGIQLYSVRDLAARDFERTLADLASIGYQTVELLDSFGNFNVPPARIREILDRYHLRAPSTHVSTQFITTNFEANLEKAKTIGHDYIMIASFNRTEAATLDDYRRWADRVNAAAITARRHDVWLGFHNHGVDFTPMDGATPYDVFIERTDPTLVRHQLDIGNLASIGRDPFDYIKRYGNRYWLFHFKDIAKLPAEGFAELGKGAVDWKRLLASINQVEQKHVFVEQENYEVSSMEHARRNFAYLSQLEF
jgi:sugar phosphate isomerase/epimerase